MHFELDRYQRISVNPLTGTIGAEIEGVDLSQPLDDATVKEIKAAFHDHIVIFFRNQALTAPQLASVGELFGPLCLGPYSHPGPDHPMVTNLLREADVPSSQPNVGDNWHADQTPRECPSLGFALYCKEAPDYGGDTLFANLYLAYEALSPAMQKLCDTLTVMHSASGKFGNDGAGKDGGFKSLMGDNLKIDDAVRRSFAAETEHPLVSVHPETGRKSLYIAGAYAIRFAGMTREESRPLLDQLMRHAIRPEFTCRFRWRAGSVAVLDNRCALHYAVNDYSGFRRVMLRAEIAGDKPYGPAMPKPGKS